MAKHHWQRRFDASQGQNLAGKFMQYDLGFFDHETCRLESVENPFRAKVLPMSPNKV